MIKYNLIEKLLSNGIPAFILYQEGFFLNKATGIKNFILYIIVYCITT